MIVEDTAGIASLGFFKKKKKKSADPEAEAAASKTGIMAKMNADGTPAAAGGSSGGGGTSSWLTPTLFIGGSLLIVGVAGYFILKK